MDNDGTVELAAKYLVEDGGVVALDIAGEADGAKCTKCGECKAACPEKALS